jgi:hypothetical protein
MEDQTCTITDPATGEKKDFSFDYCFDSHWNGSGPKPPNYADQNSIWNTLGELVLTNSFKGYNSCLFACTFIFTFWDRWYCHMLSFCCLFDQTARVEVENHSQ